MKGEKGEKGKGSIGLSRGLNDNVVFLFRMAGNHPQDEDEDDATRGGGSGRQ